MNTPLRAIDAMLSSWNNRSRSQLECLRSPATTESSCIVWHAHQMQTSCGNIPALVLWSLLIKTAPHWNVLSWASKSAANIVFLSENHLTAALSLPRVHHDRFLNLH